MLCLPAPSPFILSATLQPLPEQADVTLLDARFSPVHFDESLFQQLAIPAPEKLRQALRKRRAEYLASRWCLQQALATFGIPGFILRNRPDRSPLWPDGIAGSLSHSADRVCALLTRHPARLVGIDCERLMTPEMAHEMATSLVNPAERQRLQASGLPLHHALTAVFSAKESLYKALWPRLQQFMDFHAAEVTEIDAQGERMTLRLVANVAVPEMRGREFGVRLTWLPGEVMSRITG